MRPQKKKTTRSISYPALKEKAQEVFNKYIRLRDAVDGYFLCISCNQIKPVEQMNAGHYYPVGTHNGLRYDEMNCHGQCIACNMHRHGNIHGYREGLLKRFGKEYLMFLEVKASTNRLYKFARYELEFIIDKYKQKIKEHGK